MVKNKRRFIMSDIWSDDWFAELPGKYKFFWFYLITSCDYSGMWKIQKREADHLTCQEIDIKEAEELFADHIHVFDEKTWLLKTFIKYQYGEPLNLKNSAAKGAVLDLLLKGITEKMLNDFGHKFCYKTKKDKRETIHIITGIDRYFFDGVPLEELHLTSGTPRVHLRQVKEEEKIKNKEEIESKVKIEKRDKEALKELKSINIKKEYPVLGELKNQLTEEQMMGLLKDNSIPQIKEALEGINRTRRNIKNNSVYESVKECMNENQQLPF